MSAQGFEVGEAVAVVRGEYAGRTGTVGLAREVPTYPDGVRVNYVVKLDAVVGDPDGWYLAFEAEDLGRQDLQGSAASSVCGEVRRGHAEYHSSGAASAPGDSSNVLTVPTAPVEAPADGAGSDGGAFAAGADCLTAGETSGGDRDSDHSPANGTGEVGSDGGSDPTPAPSLADFKAARLRWPYDLIRATVDLGGLRDDPRSQILQTHIDEVWSDLEAPPFGHDLIALLLLSGFRVVRS